MTKLYAGVAAVVLVAILSGTYVLTTQMADSECAGNSLAGGGAAIGGPFELIASDGTTVTDRDVIDRPALVYFGYTFCPDVCPLDVARNSLAVDLLIEQGFDVKPVFITIDPERDTPEIMAEYAEAMHPKMEALTGSLEQIKAASQAYKTYYAKGPGEGEYYLMDHSTFTYLMLPETGLASYFGRDVAPEQMAEQVACHIRSS